MNNSELKRLIDFLNDNLKELNIIKNSNESGCCFENEEDISILLSGTGFNCKRLLLTVTKGEPKNIPQSYEEFFTAVGFYEFNIVENGSPYLYLYHYVTIVGDKEYVIDTIHNKVIKSYKDVLYRYDDYINEIKIMNKKLLQDGYQLNETAR